MSDRQWRLFEWTWKAAFACGLAAILCLATAKVPSLDDAVRGIIATIPGLMMGRTINPVEK